MTTTKPTTPPPVRAGACKAKTKTGDPCRAAVRPGRPWCFTHDPELTAVRAAARRRAGDSTRRKMGRRTVTDDGPAPPLGTNRDLVGFLATVIHEVRTGKLDAKIGGVLGNLCNVLARVLSNVEITERIAAIESAVASLPSGEADGLRAEVDNIRRQTEAAR